MSRGTGVCVCARVCASAGKPAGTRVDTVDSGSLGGGRGGRPQTVSSAGSWVSPRLSPFSRGDRVEGTPQSQAVFSALWSGVAMGRGSESCSSNDWTRPLQPVSFPRLTSVWNVGGQHEPTRGSSVQSVAGCPQPMPFEPVYVAPALPDAASPSGIMPALKG